jgi:hypothetical protein
MSKITKKEFESLYNPKTTIRKYNEILSKIDERFGEIVLTIIPDVTKKGWFDYGNCGYEGDASEGKFDLDEYKKEITVGGEYAFLPEPYGCNNSFPTRWLWEDFEDEFKKSVDDYNEELVTVKLDKKLKRIELEKRKEKFHRIIESKLTKEELKYISFK